MDYICLRRGEIIKVGGAQDNISFSVGLSESVTVSASRVGASALEKGIGLVAAKSSGLVARGLGSTGRTTAANLTEQLAMKEIVSNPRIGTIMMSGKVTPQKTHRQLISQGCY